MFGNKGMMRQMQSQMAKIQEALAKETVEGSAGGGVVAVVMTGEQKVQSVKISPEAIDPEDVGMLEDLVLTAVNDALVKSQELVAKRLGSLKIPGMF